MNKHLVFTSLFCLLSVHLFSQPDLYWAGGFQGPNTNIIYSTDFDPLGNIVVSGYYIDRVDVDLSPQGKTHTPAMMGGNAFIAKYAPNGSLLWHHELHGDQAETGHAVKVGPNGNIWWSGEYRGQLRIDQLGASLQGAPVAENRDLFLIQFSPDGQLNWARGYGTFDYDTHNGMYVDDDGNGYLCADFSTHTPAPSYLNAGTHPTPVLWFAKIDPQGHLVWENKLRGVAHSHIEDLTVDRLGNVYLTGDFPHKIDMGIGRDGKRVVISTDHKQDNTDIFLAKYSANGDLRWAKTFGSSSGDDGECLATDDQGNVYLGGQYHGTADFDSDPNRKVTRRGNGRYEAFLAKYSPEGELKWVNSLGGEAWDNVHGISIDRGGNPVIAGHFTTWCEFAPVASGQKSYRLKAPSQEYQGFVAKYQAENGKLVWAQQFGGANDDHIWSIATDSDGFIVAGGQFTQHMKVPYAPGKFLDLTGGSSDAQGLLLYLSDAQSTVAE